MIYKTTQQIMGFNFPYIKSVDIFNIITLCFIYSPLQGDHFKQATIG